MTMKFDNIAIPVDFSESSLNAFKYACDLARRHGSRVHLVHVYERSYYSVAGSAGGITYAIDATENDHMRTHITHQMKELTQRPEAKGIHFYSKLIADIPVWRFYEELEGTQIDLIVMGTRGVTGLLHGGLVGTNTERVIRHSHIPVLSVPEGAGFTDTKVILFATDFKDPLDDVYPKVVDLARLKGAAIKIGVINTQNNFSTSRKAYEAYEELKGKYPYERVELVVHNDHSVEEGIQDLVHLVNADLLAMLTHGRTGIGHLLKGSIAEDLSSTLATPLFTLRLGN
ncbi:MAG: universal stress protein [Bacteroidetes bacterium]|jgi:nucleotide-binding universal stress UspA family protein|nr:universal stress protein [Bacteroidota bacterium]